MSERVVKVPDVGEGIAEAELVKWHVAIGDTVTADSAVCDVMTDKATVEIPAPSDGVVVWLGGEPGDVLAVGSELMKISTDADAVVTTPEVSKAEPEPEPEAEATDDTADAPGEANASERPGDRANRRASRQQSEPAHAASVAGERNDGAGHHDPGDRPRAAPAVRKRALDAGVDLRLVAGSGPAGRVNHGDLDAYLAGDAGSASASRSRRRADDGVDEVKLIGLRKRIAQRMAEANAHVPHISYVDEVDVTLLQDLRRSINADGDGPKLTLLPFVIGALVEAVEAYPNCNARFDDDQPDGTGTLHVHRGVHVGIATQTDNGLMVPVIRHAETLDLFELAGEIERLAIAARDGSASSDELSGSTITITSLGALGGIATTPIINRPEVAIVGVNKLQVRPVWNGHEFTPRSMINLSSSFDHRIVDGWEAAQFVQVIRRRLEAPARLLRTPRG